MKNKILYIHGLSSSGASSTAQKLRENLPDFNVLSPDLPIHPDEALALLHSVCEAEKPQILIGTSMGGMFAQQIRGFKKILVNPAFHVSDIMRTQPGPHPFLSPRQDGETTYTITHRNCVKPTGKQKRTSSQTLPTLTGKTHMRFSALTIPLCTATTNTSGIIGTPHGSKANTG